MVHTGAPFRSCAGCGRCPVPELRPPYLPPGQTMSQPHDPSLHTDRSEEVVLVDDQDRDAGTLGKLEAHRGGMRHRAFSVFIFDERGHLMLQRRAMGKYHSPGLWSNTCCGHPRPGEEVRAAAERRLMEEMGLACTLHQVFSFTYRAELGDGMIEHELDHVFIGTTDRTPYPDPDEVMEWRCIGRNALDSELASAPAHFTAWLPLCMHKAWEHHDRSAQPV